MLEPKRPFARPVEAIHLHRWFWVFAVLTALSTVWIVWDETITRRPWKTHQKQFNALLVERGEAPEPIQIHQVTNPTLGVVDRCHSCHRGIDRPGFESDDLPPVARTHPRRDLLLGTNHEVEDVGCTVCHMGQGEQTKGVGFHHFDHGRNDPYWERPMLTGVFAESTCVTCHDREDPIPGAETFELGRRLYEEMRCFGCHPSPLVQPEFQAAPPWTDLTSKTSASFVASWLFDPVGFRPGTRMPAFWPPPIEPESGAAMDPGSEAYAAWEAMREEEVRAVTAFIGSVGRSGEFPEVEVSTDPEVIRRGGVLFDEAGCRGCHALGDADPGDRFATDRFGPDLGRVGEKVSARWINAWLTRPTDVWAGARMPDLRLTDDERSALVAFLVDQRADGVPPLVPEWPKEDPELVEAGRDLVANYGCFGCHEIPGFETFGDPASDLFDFGDKRDDLLAWGDAEIACDRPDLECWTLEKLRSPRRMQAENIELVMPVSELSEEEVLALSVFVVGNRREQAPVAYRRQLSAEEAALQEGERLIWRRNCRGCHEIGRTEERTVYEDGFVEFDYFPIGGEVRRFYDHESSAPPPLTFAGEKFQYPWLFEFLTAPTKVRPWLVARMPTFPLEEEEKTALVAYFAASNDQPYPFDRLETPVFSAEELDDALFLFEKLKCNSCHEVSAVASLEQGDLSPDLSLSALRLKPEWLHQWILDPQFLQPGTNMPTYFPLLDEMDPESFMTPYPDLFGGDPRRQADVLTALVMQFDNLALAEETE
jgi:cytochrome c2